MKTERLYSRDGEKLLTLDSFSGSEVTLTFKGSGVFTVAELEAALARLRQQPAPAGYSLGRDLYADRAVDGCSDCRPGRPCYGHGHGF